MKLVISGSMILMDKILKLQKECLELGFKEVIVPGIVATKKEYENMTKEETADRKIKYDLIRDYYYKILKSDGLLVANYEKKGIENYIGGNTFLEIGFAFVTGKPIFLLNPAPDLAYKSEILGMEPIILNGDLSKIKEFYSFS